MKTSYKTSIFLLTMILALSVNNYSYAGGPPMWQTNGNAGLDPATDFLGTTDATDLIFKANGIEYMRIEPISGSVGIGTIFPVGKLEINMGNNGDHFRFNDDGNIGLELRSGTTAGTPYIDFSNDPSTDFDMRLRLTDDNVLQVEGGALDLRGHLLMDDGPNDAAVFHKPDNSSSNSKYWFRKYTGTSYTDLMVIDNDGNVGVSMSSPAYKLDVAGGSINTTEDYKIAGHNAVSMPVNSFNICVGRNAGGSLTTGDSNSMLGRNAGFSTTTGVANSFMGNEAGRTNNGSYNSNVGFRAGRENINGDNNTGVGAFAGELNDGNYNTFLGYNADIANVSGLTNVTAIGANASVSASNSLVLGSINGVNGATASTNVGIGVTAPSEKLDMDGTARLRQLPTTTTISDVVVADANGVLHRNTAITGGGGDADWHKTGGTAPDDIYDDIYTHGKVGIGIDNPSVSLHVKASYPVFRLDNGNKYLELQSNNTNASIGTSATGTHIIFSQISNFMELRQEVRRNIAIPAQHGITITANPSQTVNIFEVRKSGGTPGDLFVIDSDGDVGIGTPTPSAKLEVEGDGTGTALGLSITDNTGANNFSVADNGDIDGRYIEVSPADLRVGVEAGAGNIGTDNVYFGKEAGKNANAALSTTYIGNGAGLNAFGRESVYVGKDAGRGNGGIRSVYIGFKAGENSVSGSSVHIGHVAGTRITGGGNTCIGRAAGYEAITTNSAHIGYGAGYASNGNQNVYVGIQAGRNAEGNRNVSLGFASGDGLIGENNITIGKGAGSFTSGSNNIYLGLHAGGNRPLTNNTFLARNITDVYFGNISSATPAEYTIHGTDGLTANIAGADVNIAGGRGTGSGTGGDITFLIAPVGLGAPTTPNALVERMRIAQDGNVGIGTVTPNNILEITGAADESGLRFTNLTSATATAGPGVYCDKVLTVDAQGDVILVDIFDCSTSPSMKTEENEELERELEATKEELAQLNSKLSDLEQSIEKCCANHQQIPPSENTAINVRLGSDPVLYQNTPNPFGENTFINFFVPASAGTAMIVFHDDYGRVLKEVDVVERGMNKVNMQGSDLVNGIYTYSLMIDGRIIDTKKMLKVR